MSCADFNRLLELLEGRLDPVEAETTRQHVLACASCRMLLAKAEREGSVSGGAGPPPPVEIGESVGRYVITGLELDPDLAPAHLRVAVYGDIPMQERRQHVERASQRDPGRGAGRACPAWPTVAHPYPRLPREKGIATRARRLLGAPLP